MRLLLDTHTFLWFIQDDPNPSAAALRLVEGSENDIFLSSASLWEMAIKISLGKLQIAMPFSVFVFDQLNRNRINILDISVQHIARVAYLPFHHRDPFDRMIIAQALVEQLPVISTDAALDLYAVQRLW